MPFFKNVSGAGHERPGDGTFESHHVEPGDIVEADTNPAPGVFEETGQPAPAPEPEPTPEPPAAAEPEQENS